MKEYKINFDLLCFRYLIQGNDKTVPIDYRVYLDGDLITERSYRWINAIGLHGTGQFVRENIWVELLPGEHEIKIESLNPTFKGFVMENIRVDNEPAKILSTGRFIISE